MHDVEGMRRFTDLLSQVGITAFALMFAAIQIRWQGVGEGSRRARDLSVTRHGKLAAITALWELLTVTLVSVAFSAATREVVGTSATPAVPPNGDFMWTWGWRAVAVACAGTGYVLAVSHVRETRNQRRLGHVATLADRFQASWGFAPFASYGILIVVALWPADATPYSWFAAVLVWFLLSGLLEVWVTLSPSMLEAEMDNIPRLVTIDAKDQSGRALSTGGIQCIEFSPDARGTRHGAVVVLPDIWGPKHDVLAFGDRLSGDGYRVVIVDYYRGSTSPLRWLGNYRRARTKAAEIGAQASEVRAWLREQKASPIHLIGFSMGGAAALLQDGYWDRIASFYPAPVDGLATSLTTLSPERVKVYLAEADHDELRRDEQDNDKGIKTVRDLVCKHLPLSHIKINGTRHGFMGTGRSIPFLLRIWPFTNWLGPNAVRAQEAEADLRSFLG